MCGIFGYVGKKNTAPEMILKGLKLLEYRGYDSWGIAIKNQRSPVRQAQGKNQNSIEVEKHVGKIGDAKITLSNSNLGVGHTRWATHGGVTVSNAHPHVDCTKKIAVVHNGIIENWAEIKKELIEKGHKFITETDTEVVPHLIEDYLKKNGFATSVRLAFNRLKGLNAIVVINSVSGEIIAAKTGSPLVVGVNNHGMFVASDVTGIAKHTKKVIFLKDNEMVILGKLGDGLKLIALAHGKEIKPKYESINWRIEQAEKGKYEHFMLKEIYEQPKVIRNIAKNYEEQIEILAKKIKEAKGTFFIGAGTAFHACFAGSYLFSKIANVHVNTALASEFNYLEHFLTKDSLIIALSQSGETIDVVEPLMRAKTKGSKIIALTNVLGSTIYRISDYKVLLGAGPEKAVPSTKVYIAKLSILLMLSFAMVNRISYAKSLLLKTADDIDNLLKSENLNNIKKIATLLSSSGHIYSIGRGISYPSALESALKIKEVSYIHTEGFAGGELKHGPIALIEKNTPCIVFAPMDETYEAIISNATEIKARNGLIIGIGPKKSEIFDHWIKINDVKEASILAQIIPAQLLGYYLAVKKGYDPDKPRNLAKSVTVK